MVEINAKEMTVLFCSLKIYMLFQRNMAIHIMLQIMEKNNEYISTTKQQWQCKICL